MLSRRRLFISAAAAIAGSPRFARAQVNRKITDVVVVVPGIMGSVLTQGGHTVWGLELSAFTELLKGNFDLAHLRVGSAQIQATRIFESVSIIPGFWRIDGYTELRKALVERLGLQSGANYFEFPYDWRLDNRISARQLREKSEYWLGNWRESSKNAEAKLIFVAHSMGGLVVRYATEVLGSRADTRKIFTVGTPYRGSMKALDKLANGLLTSGLTQTVASFDSVYQLMPTYPCIETDGGIQDVASLRAPLASLIDIDRYLEVGKSFHEECDAAARANTSKDGIAPSLTVSQSNTHRTTSGARLVGGRLLSLETLGGSNYAGDGTVPGFSLSQPAATPSQSHFSNQLHGSMQNSADLIEQIVNSILMLPYGTRSATVVSMKCSEVVMKGTDATIEIELGRRLSSPELLRIVNATTGAIVREDRVETSSLSFRGSYSMQEPGVYRAILGNPQICTDLFCVI